MVSVKEYAARKGISTQAVYKQLKTHQEQLQGHVTKENGRTVLDAFAIDYLDDNTKENPLILVDTEMHEELERLRKRETELLDQLNEKNNMLLSLKDEVMQLRLENQQLKLTQPEPEPEQPVQQQQKKWWQFWK